MRLAVRTTGQGPDLVLLHGWGLNSEVWSEAMERLSDRFRLHLVDLPGHGRSALPEQGFGLAAVIAALEPALPQRAAWLGWSLGGQVALEMALSRPDRVSRLLLLACNPQFVKSEDWPHAMGAEVLAQFAQGLEQDYQATLARFLMLQARGEPRARETVRILRQRLQASGEPDIRALRGGLSVLSESRFQSRLKQLACPSLWMLGRLDSLVPVAVEKAIQRLIPQAQTHVFQHASHAPFLSHRDEFTDVVQQFLSQSELHHV